MISLEQIRLLENKITKAVELIKSLKDENKTLRRAVNSAQTRMRDLEKLVGDFKSDQQEIEQCILRALENLDRLEEEVVEKKGRRAAAAAEKAEAAKAESPAPEPADLPPGGAGAAGGSGSEKELDIF
jgi:peptidoglycan hydrolase CwlO-like protein